LQVERVAGSERGTASPRSAAVTGGAAEALRLAVGDVVVYASHGVGRVATRRPGEGDLEELVVLEFGAGLEVTLPVERARESMRPVCGELELERVRDTLGGEETLAVQPWTKRFRMIREKVSSGDVTGLAEVVRDGIHRERQLAERGRAIASPNERQLYLKARKLLADEIGIARGIDAADADLWIVEQVVAPHPAG
jgi:RNA polymerase-interacting CarD/CdnL/TRCF family regulator